jgi:glycosyltransferase involved in cell wall biosynthesis
MLYHAHTITAPSLYLTNYFSEVGYPTLLIPNPIHVKDYPAVYTQTDVPSILYLRGYGKIYQPELVIEAMKNLVQSYSNAQAYMFGNDLDGGMEKCILLVEKYGLQNNVTINGPMPKSVWIETAKKCNVCISVPSIDNTPVSVIEAMAMGIPVITTNVGGIPAIITNEYNGLYTQPEPVFLSSMIMKLMREKDLYHFVQSNARNTAKTFNIDDVIDKWYGVLNSESKLNLL